MIDWDHAMKRARASSRMKALPSAARISFAVGALYHAYLHIRTTAGWAKPPQPVVQVLDRAFAFVWANLASPLPLGKSAPQLVTELEALSTGEDDPHLPGQPDLIDGLLGLFSLRSTGKPSALTDLGSFAYQAVVSVALPGLSGGEEDHLRAERSSESCAREIEFQMHYLSALEKLGNGKVAWDDVMAVVPR